MRINNVSSVTSKQTIVYLSLALLFYLICFIVLCIFWTPAEMFQSFLNMENSSDKFWTGFFVFILPVLFIWILIAEIKNRKEAVELSSYGLNLKYVDFLQGRIEFGFIDPKYDFSCGYDDIERLNMKLITTARQHKGQTHIVLQEIELNFTVLNNKTFMLKNTPLKPIQTIYKIIDYTRGINNFSYKFAGAGVNEDLKEKIDDYSLKGYKQLLSTVQENQFKFMSIMFFALGMFFVFSFLDHITKFVEKGNFLIFFMLSPLYSFILASFILDALLIADKINDRKFHAEHKSKELIGKIPCEIITVVQIIITAFLVFTCFKPLIFAGNDYKILKVTDKVEEHSVSQPAQFDDMQNNGFKELPVSQPSEFNDRHNDGFEELYVNPPAEFNNMRKDEIYSIRKSYVKNSLFARDDYEPNESVFGQIQDYKPWWGKIKCQSIDYEGDHHENIEGESQQSIQINNPNALVGLKDVYFMYDRQESDFCTSDYARFIPQSIKYSKKDNLIVAEYGVSQDFLNTYVQLDGGRKRYPLQLSGLNALDFGYKYVYAFDTKNIEMFNSNNITENVEMFHDFIHVGGSCEYEGGCNNISPMQPDKIITVTGLPAEINLKLWKKQPHDKYSKADMYYRIIFK